MLITKSRINSIEKYMAPFKKEEGVYVTTEINTKGLEQKLKEIGFPSIDFTGVKLVPRSVAQGCSRNYGSC